MSTMPTDSAAATDLVLQGAPDALVAAIAAQDGAMASCVTGISCVSGVSGVSAITRLSRVTDNAALRQFVDRECIAAGIDYAFMPSGARLSDYKLLVMDMDSTLITIECIDEIADLCGLKPQVAAITEAAMRGEISDYKESLRRRVALLEGLDAGAMERVYRERLQLSPGAEVLLAAVRAAGLKTLLVSGGFTDFTDRLKSRLGLDYTHSNTLGVAAGKLTGTVLGDIVDATEKARKVSEVCATLGISTRQAIVIGDGANDLRMIALAGIGVAYHAKPVVRAQASHAINFGGLDTLLGWFVAQAD